MRIALYEPDIPQNCGALIRLGACLGLPVDIIEPCGFLFSDKGLKRAGMDYVDSADVVRHASWQRFLAGHRQKGAGRLVLLTSKAAHPYTGFAFIPDDTILLGRESAGVPEEVHDAVDARLLIPMRPGLRSINVAQAAAMVVGEALRQTKGFP
jgi:tRNA (cytidine/uridine-2'-O-)-methyltransferase